MSPSMDWSHLDELLTRCHPILFHTHLETLVPAKALLRPSSTHCSLYLMELNFSPEFMRSSKTLLMVMHTFSHLRSSFAYIIHNTGKVIKYYLCFSLLPDFASFSLSQLASVLPKELTAIPFSSDDSLSLLKDTLLGNPIYQSLACTSTFHPTNLMRSAFENVFKPFTSTPFTYMLLCKPYPLSKYQTFKTTLTQLQSEMLLFRTVTLTDDRLMTTLCTDNHSNGETGYNQTGCTNVSSHTDVHSSTDVLNKSYSLPSKLYDQVSLTPTLAQNKSDQATCTHANNLTNTQTDQRAFSTNQSDSHSQTHTNKFVKSSTFISQSVSDMVAQGDSLLAFYNTELIPPLFECASYFLTPDSFSSSFMGTSLSYLLTQNQSPLFPRFNHVIEKQNPVWQPLLDTLCTLEHPAFYHTSTSSALTPALLWRCSAITQLITPIA